MLLRSTHPSSPYLPTCFRLWTAVRDTTLPTNLPAYVPSLESSSPARTGADLACIPVLHVTPAFFSCSSLLLVLRSPGRPCGYTSYLWYTRTLITACVSRWLETWQCRDCGTITDTSNSHVLQLGIWCPSSRRNCYAITEVTKNTHLCDYITHNMSFSDVKLETRNSLTEGVLVTPRLPNEQTAHVCTCLVIHGESSQRNNK